MFRKNLIAVAAVVALGGTLSWMGAQNGPHSGQGPNHSAAPGSNFEGTWWLNFGPPPQRPLILTMDAGTFILEDSVDGGGHTPTASFSIVQGIWARSGPHSARALGLRFVYDALGKTKAVERVRFTLSFTEGFHRTEGQLQIEEMGCVEQVSPLPFTVPVCPDPTTEATQVLRGPAPVNGVRLTVDAPVM